jgi:hypothetical protein
VNVVKIEAGVRRTTTVSTEVVPDRALQAIAIGAKGK